MISSDDFTICGFCNERVRVDRGHGCEIIKNLKKSFNDVLITVQKDIADIRSNNADLIDQIKSLAINDKLGRIIYNNNVFEKKIAWQDECLVALHKRVANCEDSVNNVKANKDDYEVSHPNYIKLRLENSKLKEIIEKLQGCLKLKLEEIDKLRMPPYVLKDFT